MDNVEVSYEKTYHFIDETASLARVCYFLNAMPLYFALLVVNVCVVSRNKFNN